MTDNSQLALAETVFDRGHAGESEPSDALKLEAARRAAVVENTRRLRALRLAQKCKAIVPRVLPLNTLASDLLLEATVWKQ
jgi:hypothetical protein